MGLGSCLALLGLGRVFGNGEAKWGLQGNQVGGEEATLGSVILWFPFEKEEEVVLSLGGSVSFRARPDGLDAVMAGAGLRST